ncbi:hypothetical protein LCGC14_2794630 [marine sediment metagenome]|uniref:Uncharacterized protein n=1 Tax=marine sediment metagenome TaxID=412755 RepID=A0A0F9BFW2_9ZZZZ
MAHKMSYGKGSMGKSYKKGSMSKGMKGKSMKHYGRSEAVGGYVEKRMVPKGPYAPK